MPTVLSKRWFIISVIANALHILWVKIVLFGKLPTTETNLSGADKTEPLALTVILPDVHALILARTDFNPATSDR